MRTSQYRSGLLECTIVSGRSREKGRKMRWIRDESEEWKGRMGE
jgi:hypothetical protein